MFLLRPLLAQTQIAMSLLQGLLSALLLLGFYLWDHGWLGSHQIKCSQTREDGVHIIYLLRVWLSSLYTSHCAHLSTCISHKFAYLFWTFRRVLAFLFRFTCMALLSHQEILSPLTFVFTLLFWILIIFVPPPVDHDTPGMSIITSIPIVNCIAPYPSRWLILSNVNLYQSFVGYLTSL